MQIYTNERKVCKFRARDDIEEIRAINVRGDAFIYEVKLQRRVVSIKELMNFRILSRNETIYMFNFYLKYDILL